jgi:hypothetical protein
MSAMSKRLAIMLLFFQIEFKKFVVLLVVVIGISSTAFQGATLTGYLRDLWYREFPGQVLFFLL